jgi:DUF4097 and DUF4098 domain-containing protein YvlB
MGWDKTEKPHAAEAILSEANGGRSRDKITIESGSGVVKANTVVGKLTVGGKFKPSSVGVVSGDEGAETAVAVTIYEVDATSADVDVAAIARDAEMNGKCLNYEASVDLDAEKTAKAVQLAAVGIVVR